MSRTQTVSAHTVEVPLHARNKKNSMTGGGRAWREDEEAYLLRTRLQKMPYKHIAAHLNKTELACRLHYHQLSHGSSRRKRTASSSSGSDQQSPVMPNLTPSPPYSRVVSRSISPPLRRLDGHGRFVMTPPPQLHDVQLPSIMANGCSPRVPTILPKPASMGLPSRAASPLGYPPSMPDHHQHQHQHQQQQLPPFRSESSQPTAPSSLRLDCSLPLPSASTHSPAHVDLNRLHAVYAAHRDRFWDVVAAEYGGASPTTLEKAWKSGRCCSPQGYGPLASPKEEEKMSLGHVMASRDKTRISSLISAD
ncbi:hypothetical protein PWT90_05602 [Aphanocladium album]|nr:hypothetical protein PWT90_05602 [Aphanocladium album]